MTPTEKLRGTLARQLTLGIVLVAIAVALMSTSMLSQLERESLERGITERQLALAQAVSFHYRREIETDGDLGHFQEIVTFLGKNTSHINGIAVRVGGQIIAQAHREGEGDAEWDPATLEWPAAQEIAAQGEFVLRRHGSAFAMFLPLKTRTGETGAVCVLSDPGQMQQQLRANLRRIALVTLIVSLILGVALHRLLRGVVTRPLRRLAETAERVAGGDLEARVTPAADNEIGAAGRAVNAMADTLVAQARSLRASEARHRALFQSASDACFLIDALSARVVEVNSEAARLLGCRVRDLVGRSVAELAPAQDRGTLRLLGQQLAARGEVSGWEEISALRRDGTTVPVSINARRLTLGEEALIYASVRDISAQRRAAAEVQRQLRRVMALHAASRACSTSLDPDAIHRAIFEQVRATMPCDALLIEHWDQDSGLLTPVFLAELAQSEPLEVAAHNGVHPAVGSALESVVLQRRAVSLAGPAARAFAQAHARSLTRSGDLQSLLAVPMVSGDRVVGVLTALSTGPEAHSAEDLDLLSAMANQAALAIANARLHQATQRALRTREALNHLAKAIGATLDLTQIARTVYAEVVCLFPTDAFFLSVIDPEATRDTILLMVDTIDGERREISDRADVPLRDKFTGHIVRTRRAHLELRAPDEIPAEEHLAYGDATRRSASLMYVPLIARERVVGVMSVQSYTPNAYTPEDLELLQAVGDLTALALENGRLYNEVAASEARHRALVENTAVSIILTDLAGSVVLWNRGAEQIFGRRPEEMLGRPLAEVFTDETFNPARIAEALRHQGTWTAEGMARHRDGSLREIVYSVAQVTDASAQPVGRVVIASDLTEKKTLERALLQAQKMESIGTLAGGIAHDFNNLLTGILGYATYLQTQAEPGTRMSRDLEQIERAAKRASELTQQLLAFSRKQMIRHEVINLNQVVDDTVRLMERTLGKHIQIEVIKDPNLKMVEADPTQMQQVLMNLAINARDAMPSGGILTLTTRNVELDEAYCRRRPEMTPGPHVQVTVADTGEGMSEETMARIFNPFFTTKPVGQGTGLGLAMVYGIIRSHGGTIEVASELGVGTTFAFHLPIAAPAASRPGERADDGDVRGGHETILLVDDEPIILRMGAAILERFGYTVLTAPSGRAALSIFQNHGGKIDLVVVDILMPEMNGTELAERLRECDPGIRVLLSSGYALDQNIEALLSAGNFVGFLAKPYRMNQLVSHVRHALDAPLPL